MTFGVKGVRTVAVNTDREHLWRASCDDRVLLGDGAVRGTGGRPEIGARLAGLHEKELRAAASGGDLTFVITGLGGGTGTGVAPIVANWARQSGAIVVGLATMPFRAESHRQAAAQRGLEAMRAACNSLVVLENDRLLQRVPDLPVEQAFAVLDHMLGEVIRGLSSAVNERSLIQLDFPDLREVLREGGLSALLFGEGDPYQPDAVVENVLRNSLFDADTEAASGAIVHMTAGPGVPLRTVDHVVEGLRKRIHRHARTVFGVRTDPEFEGSMRVMTLLTGVHARPQPPPSEPDTGVPVIA